MILTFIGEIVDLLSKEKQFAGVCRTFTINLMHGKGTCILIKIADPYLGMWKHEQLLLLDLVLYHYALLI